MKRLTITDVAKEAKVSKTTMSRYLNGNFSRMSETTRTRIEETVTRLNYRPVRQAQSLKSKNSYLIGVLIADISNIYASPILKGIGNILRPNNYEILIMDTANSPELEKKELYRLIDQRVDGIIIQPILRESDAYAFVNEYEIPVTLLDREVTPALWPTVSSNNYEVTRDLTEYLMDKNYQRIFVVSEPVKAISPREQRYQAIIDVASKKQVEVILVEITTNDIEPLKAYEKDLKNKDIKTVIFSANSKVLTMVLKYLSELNMQIPTDIGVTGFDDWGWSAVAGPGLTSIEQKPIQIGELAAELVLKQIQQKDVEIKNYVVPASIQYRKSL